MRIAVLLSSFGGGGAERMLTSLASDLTVRGHEVILLVGRPEGPWRTQVADNVVVRSLKKGRARYALLQSVKVVLTEAPDIVLASQPHMNMLAVLTSLVTPAQVPVVLRLSNVVSRHHLNQTSDFVGRLHLKFLQWLYGKATRLVAVSSSVEQDVMKSLDCDRGRIRVIYNGPIDAQFYKRVHQPLASLNLPKVTDGSLVVTIGRLAWQKNHSLLLRAFAIVAQRLTRAHLYIVGDGPESAALRELVSRLDIEKRVTFTGFIPNPLPLLRKARVFALSSRYEGMPSALIEALGAGCELVATDCPGGSAEILKGGRYGRLVPADDVEAFADALLERLTADKKLNSMPRRAVERFRREHMVEEYEKLFVEIASQRRQ